MCNVKVTAALCTLMVFSFIYNVSSKYCTYHSKNYTECDLMYWTNWTPCTGGHGKGSAQCPLGNEKRQKALCCPRATNNDTDQVVYKHCKINCNMTDDDFDSVRPLTTGKTLHSVGNVTKEDDGKSKDLPIEVIAGIAAAGAVVLAGLCSLFICLLCKRHKKKRVKPEQQSNEERSTK